MGRKLLGRLEKLLFSYCLYWEDVWLLNETNLASDLLSQPLYME